MNENEYIEKLNRRKISLQDIPEEERTEAIYLVAVKRYRNAIQHIKNPSEEVCLASVKKNGRSIQYIENPSEEVCLEAVKDDGLAIQYIKNPTQEMCLEAVKNDGLAIQYIENPSEEVCIEAVKDDGLAIQYIENPSEEVCIEAVRHDGMAIQDIKHPTEAIILEAVKQNGMAIQYVEDKNERICLVAVKQNGLAIKYIENPSEEISLAAVIREPLAIEYIKNPSEEVCLEAVRKEWYLIECIENPSEVVCMEAIKQNVDALEYIKNPTEAMYIEAIKHDERAIDYIKEPSEAIYWELVSLNPDRIRDIKNPSKELLMEAVKNDGYVIRHVENPSDELCLAAVKQNGMAIQYIKNPSEEICIEAVKQNGMAIRYIKNLSEEICIEAVKQNGMAIRYIKNLSEMLCLEAVKQDGRAIRYIENSSEAVRLAAVKQDGMAIRYIENPSEAVCIEAVKQSGQAIQYIKNPSEELCLEAVRQSGLAIQYIENPSEEICIEAVNQNHRSIRYIKNPTDEFYLGLVKRNVNTLELVPKKRITLEIIKVVKADENPNVTIEEVIEFCKSKHPYALFNSGKEGEIFEAISEKIGNNPQERETLNKLMHIAKYDKKYIEPVIDDFWGSNIDLFINDFLPNNNERDSLEEHDYKHFANRNKHLINNAINFEEKLGYIPEIKVACEWKNPVEEYSKKEHKKLLEAGIIKKSKNYKEEEHKTWILKMYQLFGYAEALRMLETIPDLTEEMAQELMAEDEIVYNQVYEKKYILTGEIALTVDIINKINNIAEKDAFKIFKEINILLEQGNIKTIKEILLKYNLDEKKIDKVLKSINLELNKEKIEKVDDNLKLVVNGNVTHQQGRIYDLILKVIKVKLESQEEITEENLEKAILEELNKKEETGEYVYSPVIRREEENIKQSLKQFIQEDSVKEILNNNIIKILGKSKEKIGQGWIRKIIGISEEMTKEEYEKTCEKLGIEKIEHEEEIRLKGKDEETKEKALELISSLECPELLTFEKMEVMFGGLRSPYSKAFAEYFIKHKDEIMGNPEYIENFAKMHNKFDAIINNKNIKKAYEEGRLKVQTVLDETLNNHFLYRRGEAELVKRAREAQLDGEYWKDAQEVFKITREREETTIPPTKVVAKKFRGRMLRVDDPLQLFVGDMTGCCQRFGDVGEGAMLHGATEKNGGIFVIEEIDENGNAIKLVAQSWTWRNDDVMCFDNIEVKGDRLTYEEQAEVLQIYKDAASKAIEIDKRSLKEMQKQGKITKDQYKYYTLKEVRIGLGYNQGMRVIEEKMINGELEKSYDIVRPKEAEKGYKISGRNVTPWIDSELSVIIARNEEMPRIDRSDNIKGETPVTYSKPREIREEQGENIDEDLVDIIKQIERETYRKEQQIMQYCENVEDIADAQACSVEKLKVAVSRDKDWYAMYYEQDDSIYITDIALLNGTNSEKNSQRKTETIISSLELAKKMYEVFIEAAESGKKITCDATKDTSGLNIKSMVKNGLVQVEDVNDYDWDENIKMSQMTLTPNKEKIQKELEKLEKLIQKAEQRRRVYKRETQGIGGDDR